MKIDETITRPGACRAPTRFPGREESELDVTEARGGFGGTFAPEILLKNLRELESNWLSARADPRFTEQLDGLLRDFAGRATPLMLAERLSERVGAEIWLKREDLLHTGAHKLNNAIGQGLLAKLAGKRRIIAETGAGQHGVATATIAAKLGLQCTIYMGARDAERQAPNVERMRLLGASVELVHGGTQSLKDAVDEAMRAWVSDPLAHYLLGSALGPHPFPSLVADFQSVIGREARAQFAAQAGGLPDAALACVGGGSNAIGLFRAFVDTDVALIGVEAGGHGLATGRHAARFQGGSPGVLHGAYTYVLQTADGQVRETTSISAGLDYPAVGPEHASLLERGRARYFAATDPEALEAFHLVCRMEGILPALESSHAIGWLLAQRGKLDGKRIVVCLSGRGDKDLANVLAASRASEQGDE